MTTGNDPNPRALQGSRILVSVTGGIAAYKTCTLVSRLVQSDARVTVLMTQAATEFVCPLTFETLSGRPVITSIWDQIQSLTAQHIDLATQTDLAIVAPCTMDCLARLAMGRADDVVSLVLAAIDRKITPVLLAPAMNTGMWTQPTTQRNVQTLRSDGFTLIDPTDGWQACRTQGPGRMTEPDDLFQTICNHLIQK